MQPAGRWQVPSEAEAETEWQVGETFWPGLKPKNPKPSALSPCVSGTDCRQIYVCAHHTHHEHQTHMCMHFHLQFWPTPHALSQIAVGLASPRCLAKCLRAVAIAKALKPHLQTNTNTEDHICSIFPLLPRIFLHFPWLL